MEEDIGEDDDIEEKEDISDDKEDMAWMTIASSTPRPPLTAHRAAKLADGFELSDTAPLRHVRPRYKTLCGSSNS